MAHERRWTREAVIEAIQLWAERHDGVPPKSTDWMPIKAERGADYPHATSIYARKNAPNAPFHSWADAIEAAGFPRPRGSWKRVGGWRPRKRVVWSQEEVIRQIQAKSKWGRAPSTRVETILLSRAIHYFGSWEKACEAAGVVPRKTKRYT